MNARETLKLAGQFDKEMAKLAGQEISKNLNRRQKDHANMIQDTKKDWSGYHKPGSQKK